MLKTPDIFKGRLKKANRSMIDIFTGIGNEKGIDMYYNSRDHRFSSSGLRKQVKIAENK